MKPWPVQHWLVAAQLVPLLIGPVYWLLAAVLWIGNIGLDTQDRATDALLFGLVGVGVVLAAWGPVYIGVWLYARSGPARPWLVYGPLPTLIALTFVFGWSSLGWALISPAWALSIASTAAGMRYARQRSSLPPLPPHEDGSTP